MEEIVKFFVAYKRSFSLSGESELARAAPESMGFLMSVLGGFCCSKVLRLQRLCSDRPNLLKHAIDKN